VQAADVDAARQGARLGLYTAAMKFDATLGVPFAGMAGQHVFGAARRELLLQLGWTTQGVPPPTALVDEVPAPTASLAPSAEDVAMARGFGALASIVRELAEPARNLLLQVYVEDRTITDIAAQRGVRQQTVSGQHKRILAAVKAGLEEVA